MDARAASVAGFRVMAWLAKVEPLTVTLGAPVPASQARPSMVVAAPPRLMARKKVALAGVVVVPGVVVVAVAADTVTLTGAEEVAAPALLVARAVRARVPVAVGT